MKKNKMVKFICVFWGITIAFTFLMIGWKYFRDIKVNQEKYEKEYSEWQQSKMTSDDIKKEMTQEAINEAYDRVYCWKLMKEGTDYLENSILMKIDPYAKPVGTIRLSNIDHSKDELEEYVNSAFFIEKVKEQLGWNIENQFIQELIQFDKNVQESIIKVCAQDEITCEKMAIACQDVIKNQFGEVECNYSFRTEVDLSLLDKYNQIAEANRAYEEQAIYYELNTADGAMELFEAILREEYPEISVGNNVNLEEPILKETHITIETVGTALLSGMLCATAIILIYFMIQSINNEEREQK